MANSKQTSASEELKYASGDLKRETGWWGAFVIGLAGTILVTGIAPVMVTQLGASAIPITVFITLTGWLLCLIPGRASGHDARAHRRVAVLTPILPIKDRWPRFAKHINGFTAWAYWLGWFPVAPLNMILASFYLADRFHLNTTAGFTPIHTFIAWSTLIIAVAGHSAVLHPGLSRHPLRRHLRDGPGALVDDPADLHRGRLDFQPERREPRRAVWISSVSTDRASSPTWPDSSGGRFISPMASC